MVTLAVNPQKNASQVLIPHPSRVNPCCLSCVCCAFTPQQFLVFLNLWDIIFSLLTSYDLGFYSMILKMAMIILAVISLIKFRHTRNMFTEFHIFYAKARLIISLLYIAIATIMLLVEGFVFTQPSISFYLRKLFLLHMVVIIVILGPVGCLSFHWSIMLKNCIEKEMNIKGYSAVKSKQSHGFGSDIDSGLETMAESSHNDFY